MLYFESLRDKTPYFHRADNNCPPHFHRSVELLYVLSGEKRIWIDGKDYFLKEKEFAIVPPYAPHTYEPSPSSEQIVFTFFNDLCPKFESLCKNAVPSTHTFQDKGDILPMLLRLQTTRNEILYTGIINYILGIYVENIRFLPMETQKGWAFAEKVSEYVNEHYADPLDVKTLAKAFGYSPNYFSTVFKRFFKVGVNQYVNAVRVQKSVPMLKSKKIFAVCHACGFNSPQQYHLHFKKFYGCSPKTFLKATMKLI